MPGISPSLHTIDIDNITINREVRQRTEIDDLSGLIQDISLRGLLNPIIISKKDKRLIAGERRLTSYRTLALGWTGDPDKNPWKKIPYRYYDELDEHDAQIVELSENLHRKELPWRDMAVSITKIHSLRLETNPEWTQAKTAAELGMTDTAVSVNIAVGESIAEGKLDFSGCASAAAANNIIKRARERENDAMLASLTHAFGKPTEEVTAKLVAPTVPIIGFDPGTPEGDEAVLISASKINEIVVVHSAEVIPKELVPKPADLASRSLLHADFFEFAANYSDEPFNLLHCDFPYGINLGDAKMQNSAVDRETYEDSPDLFWQLTSCLLDNQNKLVAQSAHIMFWFSLGLEPECEQTGYERIFRAFTMCGWSVNRFPLIWCRNASILPDPNRGPRRGYETAFLMTRGDRKVVRPVQNFYEDSDRSEKSSHHSEKPQEMLKHFLGMLVDGTTRMLDPTAGSGSAIRAAHKLGADHVLGLEKNPEFVKLAQGKFRADQLEKSILGDLG